MAAAVILADWVTIRKWTLDLLVTALHPDAKPRLRDLSGVAELVVLAVLAALGVGF